MNYAMAKAPRLDLAPWVEVESVTAHLRRGPGFGMN
jgi:hypothetical protein